MEQQATTSMPVFSICGWSGSGKTTLLVKLVERYCRRDLRVAVIKHDVHKLELDREGKDSFRLFQAGADIVLQSSAESFIRSRLGVYADLDHQMLELGKYYDLVLVEGRKHTPLPKIWLLGEGESQCPETLSNVRAVLTRDEDRLAAATGIIDEFIEGYWDKSKVSGCILIDSDNRRMPNPRHLLMQNDRSWLQSAIEIMESVCDRVVIVGDGDMPEAVQSYTKLPDAPDAAGPLAGILAALRWDRRANWLIAACDLPNITVEALKWLLSLRRPGVWAILPKLQGARDPDPSLSYYDRRSACLLEKIAARNDINPLDIVPHRSVIEAVVPKELEGAWQS